jgi:hypothetical protein
LLILLPPSEGKTPPSEGAPVALESLAFPGLIKTRSRLLDVLARLTLPRALKYLDVSSLVRQAGWNVELTGSGRSWSVDVLA